MNSKVPVRHSRLKFKARSITPLGELFIVRTENKSAKAIDEIEGLYILIDAPKAGPHEYYAVSDMPHTKRPQGKVCPWRRGELQATVTLSWFTGFSMSSALIEVRHTRRQMRQSFAEAAFDGTWAVL